MFSHHPLDLSELVDAIAIDPNSFTIFGKPEEESPAPSE